MNSSGGTPARLAPDHAYAFGLYLSTSGSARRTPRPLETQATAETCRNTVRPWEERPHGRLTPRQSEAMERAPSARAPVQPVPIPASARIAAGSTSRSGQDRSLGSTPVSAPEPSRGCNDELTAEILRLRCEITQLHCSIGALTAAITALASRPPGSFMESPAELGPPVATVSPATLLALRSGERLNGEVQRRMRLGGDADSDTELDLLIDRLHDLSDAGS